MLNSNFGFEQPRWILHIDADAFFASVEEAINPSYKNKPMAVGGNDHRGVIASANYAARKYGLHSGMSCVKAKALCPKVILVKPQFETYKYFSQRMFEILENFSPAVEKTSIDEGYVDLTGTELMWGMQSQELALFILRQIQQKLNIPISGGLSKNKLISQIASKLFKPHRFVTVPHGFEEKFLWPLSIKVIPGVGEKTYQHFSANNISKISDLAALSLYEVSKKYGYIGECLWQKIQKSVGNLPDKETLQTGTQQPKSISHETTFRNDLSNIEDVKHELIHLMNKVLFRMRRHKAQTSAIFLKMKSSNFHSYTFHRRLSYPTDFDGDLMEEGQFLLRENFFAHRPLRLIGFGVEKLQTTYNLSMFQHDHEEKQRLSNHLDQLRLKYGFDIVSYGA